MSGFSGDFRENVNERQFPDGVLFSHFHLHGALSFPHGHAFWNYPTGRRRIEGYYNNGIRSGRWTEFEPDGNVRSAVDFGHGEYVKPTTKPKLEEVTFNPETLILLEEEFGYRHWFWLPDRPMSELIEWWRGLFSVEPWFVNPEPLPGILIEGTSSDRWNELYASRKFIWGHINDDDDSELRLPIGETIFHSVRRLHMEERAF